MNAIIDRAEYILGVVLLVIGACAVALAFFNSPLLLQITIGLAGLGFFVLGLVQLKRTRKNEELLEKFERIASRLDEIKQELEKEEKTEGTGIAIADVISSGLKYYAERLNKKVDEE